MAETVGPQLEGSIELNIKEFRAGVSELTKSVTTITKTFETLNKSITSMQNQLNNTSKSYQNTSRAAKQAGDVQSKAAQKAADLEQKKANAIARAANRIYTMEQSVKKSNATQQQQAAVISRLRGSLQQYGDAVNRGKMSTIEMDNANTKLSTSLGAATRQLREYTKSTQQSERQQVANMKVLNEADVSYRRAANAINRSEMSTEQKDAAMKRLNKTLTEVKRNTDRYGSGTVQTVGAQNQLKKAIAETNIQAQNANKVFRQKKMESWRAQMMDLTSSVQLALGPLSGIASRIQALTALFNRNAVAVAGLFASITGITVAFGKSIKAGIEAERQLRSLEGVVAGLGDTADVTGQELFDMGTRVGAALLTSAAEARRAAGAVASFGSISKNQFEEVLTAAQGLTETMGGNLQQNVKKLGRLLDDPATNFDSLRESGVAFSEETKETVRSLRAQGRVFEANEVLLERFSFATEAAQDSANSLAGSLDTAGENLNRFFEVMFTDSGAAEVARAQVDRFSQVLSDMINSDAAKRFGEGLATALNVAGNSINLVVENLSTLRNLLVSAVIYSLTQFIGKMFAAIGITRASTAALYQHAKANGVAAAATKVYTKATTLAAAATKTLSRLLRTTAFGAVLYGITALGMAWATAGDEVEDYGTRTDKTLSDVEKRIKNFQGFSTQQKEEALDILPNVEDIRSRNEKAIAEIEKQRSKLSRQIGNFSQDPITQKSDEVKEAKQEYRDLGLQISILESAIEGAESQAESLLNLFEQQNEQNQKYAKNTGAIVDNAKKLREEFLREDVALEQLTTKISEAETGLGTLREAYKNGNTEVLTYIQYLEKVLPVMKEQKEELESNSSSVFKASRAYKTLTNALTDMEGQLRLASATETGKAFEKLKEQVNLDKELSNLRQQLSGLSDTEYRKLAEAIDLNISKMQSEEAIQKSVTNAYLNKASALRQEINAQNALRSARESAQGIEQGAMSGMDSAQNTYQEEMLKIEELGRSMSLEDQQRYQQTALQLRLNYLEQVKQIEDNMANMTRFTPLSEVEQLQAEFDRRRQVMIEELGKEEALASEHYKEMEKNFEKQKMFKTFAQNAESAQNVVGSAMEAMSAMGRENTKEYQMMALAQSAISQALAVSQVWADPKAGTFEKVAMAAMAAMQVGAQIKQIKSASYATGGEVRGPGTSTSDSVPAMLSAGEFVMRASAVRKFGMDTLNRMNEGKMPKMREGGAVMPIAMNSGNGGGSNVEVNIYNESSNVEVEERRSTDSMGNQRLDMYIRDTVNTGLATGAFDRSLGGSFGLTRQGRGR